MPCALLRIDFGYDWQLSGFAGSTLKTTRALQTLVDAVPCFVLHSLLGVCVGRFSVSDSSCSALLLASPTAAGDPTEQMWVAALFHLHV